MKLDIPGECKALLVLGTKKVPKMPIFPFASNMGTVASRKLRDFTDDDVNKIAETYHQ